MTIYRSQKYQLLKIWINLSILVSVFVFSSLAQGAVVAQVDRSTMKLGETITLVVQTGDQTQSLDIDLSLLTDNFHLLDTRNDSMVSFTNGVQSATIRSLYVLEPKKLGKLMIPAFNLGKLNTQAIEITVEPAPVVGSGEPEVVFIEIQSHDDKVYVHSQLALTVRLYYRYSLIEGSLPDPQIEYASVVKLGETSMNATRNGVSYRALERVYAVFPERSGELIIPEISFLGRVNEPSKPSSGSIFTPRSRGRRVRAVSKPLSISVQPRPAQYPATEDWLPARQLLVNSQLKTAKDGVRVGEPVTRVVEIKAVGLLDTMLPDIVWPPMNNARVYPDAPESVSRNAGQWVTGQKLHSFAIVAEHTGDLLLPEMQIPWWDTLADELKYAIIPAEIVNVLPALSDAASTPHLATEPVAETISEAAKPTAANTSGATDSNLSDEAKGWWQIFAIIGFTLWILTLLLCWLSRGKLAVINKTEADSQPESVGFISLKQACNNNDLLAAVSALRQFAINELSITDGLNGLERACTDDGFEELAGSIGALNRQLYAQPQTVEAIAWDGKAFYQQFNLWFKQAANRGVKKSRQTLPPFYPV